MKISELKTNYPTQLNPQNTSFRSKDGQSSGNNVLLGTVAAASAAVAGVALYKNHKTGKVLKDTFTKLKQTEIDLSAAKEKIAETQKKLDSISDVSVEEKKTGKFGKKLKKTGKKVWKKTKKTWKKTKKAFRNIGEKFSWSKDKTEKYSENNKYDSKAQKTIKKLQKKIDKLESDAAKNKNKYNVDSESGKEKNTGFWSKIKNIFTKSKDKTAEKTSKKSNEFSDIIDRNNEKVNSEKESVKTKKIGFFSRMKNTIQTKWYERKLDKAYKKNQEPLSEKNISSYEETLRKAVEKSDKRNEKWLAKQRAQEEKEYEKFWQKAEIEETENKLKKPGFWKRFFSEFFENQDI